MRLTLVMLAAAGRSGILGATPIPLPVQTASNRSVQAHPGPVIEPGTWRVRR
mgnify:CR=1 FL=1